MSVEFDRGSLGKFDSRTLGRETLSKWTGRSAPKVFKTLERRTAAYPLVGIRQQTVPSRAIRGKSSDSRRQYPSQQYPPPPLTRATDGRRFLAQCSAALRACRRARWAQRRCRLTQTDGLVSMSSGSLCFG